MSSRMVRSHHNSKLGASWHQENALCDQKKRNSTKEQTTRSRSGPAEHGPMRNAFRVAAMGPGLVVHPIPGRSCTALAEALVERQRARDRVEPKHHHAVSQIAVPGDHNAPVVR